MPKRLTNRSTNAVLGLAHDYLVQALSTDNRREQATCFRLAEEYLRRGKAEIARREYGAKTADRWAEEYRVAFQAAHDEQFVDVYGEVI